MSGTGPHPHPPGPAGDPGPWDALSPVLSPALAPALVAVLLGAAYLRLARRARRRNAVLGWSRARTAAFLAGLATLALALLPPLAPWAHGDFRGHMAQHLLIGMYAPLGLVLGAPVTLLLRTLPPPRARALTALLHSAPARLLTHPLIALILSTGTLALVYFTPLYTALASAPGGHELLHAHFLLSGCLFAHAVAGPDPAPARPGVPARLVVLGVAVAAHATVSQLLYGGFLVQVPVPAEQLRGAGELMYYGGDLAELLLAAALVATWRPARHPTRAPVSAAPSPAAPSPAGPAHA
ncbi:cytochrome c oxidase assembly protein [Streptomyces sp. KE1]|uniref:cytochrome c oxidase assembly protein n=1 Tax=Streptomyces sp. KE1 TaxID=1638939 RepID=UPI00099C7D5B|nr:cytochrome c oxidase assembly protein [Streptomyces sp. KE1]